MSALLKQPVKNASHTHQHHTVDELLTFGRNVVHIYEAGRWDEVKIYGL